METNHNPNARELRHESSDELEQLALREVLRRKPLGDGVRTLVIPGGHGDFALQLASDGALVTVIDEPRFIQEIEQRAKSSKLSANLVGAEGSLAALPEEPPGTPYDIVFCRRGFCRLPYASSVLTLRQLLRQTKIGGKLYVSVLGLHSELGDDYPGAEQDVTDRFCPLSPVMAEKYGIHDPVCLYSERNLFMLALEAGGSVLRTFTTTHGNVRAVIVRV